jgi:hypothetical protein
MVEFGFCSTGMALNDASQFKPAWNGLEWQKSVWFDWNNLEKGCWFWPDCNGLDR